jgi:hypothetical protein
MVQENGHDECNRTRTCMLVLLTSQLDTRVPSCMALCSVGRICQLRCAT